MKNKKGTAFIVIGFILLLAAISLIVYNIYTQKNAQAKTEYFTSLLTEEILSAKNDTTSSSATENTLNSETEIPDHVLNPQMDMPTVTIEGNEYVGILEIPALSLSLSVLNTWSYQGLNVSPCRYTGSPYTDNLVIAAHNYPCHFASIHLLSEGDKISFTDVKGNVYNYKVVLTETVAATAVEDMTESSFALTLFTCNYSGQARIAVRCENAE